MKDPKILAALHRMFDAQNKSLAAMREVNRLVFVANETFGKIVQAHDVAIANAMESNHAAIELLNTLEAE